MASHPTAHPKFALFVRHTTKVKKISLWEIFDDLKRKYPGTPTEETPDFLDFLRTENPVEAPMDRSANRVNRPAPLKGVDIRPVSLVTMKKAAGSGSYGFNRQEYVSPLTARSSTHSDLNVDVLRKDVQEELEDGDFSFEAGTLNMILMDTEGRISTNPIFYDPTPASNGNGYRLFYKNHPKERQALMEALYPDLSREEMDYRDSFLVIFKILGHPGKYFATSREMIIPRLLDDLDLATDSEGSTVGLLVRLGNKNNKLCDSSTYLSKSVRNWLDNEFSEEDSGPEVSWSTKQLARARATRPAPARPAARRPAKKQKPSGGLRTFTQPLFAAMDSAAEPDKMKMHTIITFLTTFEALYPDAFESAFSPLYAMPPTMFFSLFNNPMLLKETIENIEEPDAKLLECIDELSC